jgi:sugar phosphate isomerase/epimerase
MEAETDWGLVERLLSETITPYVNTHIDPSPERYPGLIIDNPTEAQAAEIVENTAKDLKYLVDHFGANMVIAENSPYHANKGRVIRTAVEPEVITNLIEEAGCGLLLDLSHARISARYLGMDEWEYLEKLPVQRLREMHFTGIHQMDGRLVDHLGALPGDWQALKKAMELIHSGKWGQPWMLAFEYGGVGGPFAWRSDPGVMAEQMPVLWEIVKH